jgi:hypothetical protein
MIAEAPSISATLRPSSVCVNPVFEIRHASSRLLHVTLDGSTLPSENFAWDGNTLWLDVTLREPAKLRFEFHD